MATEIAIFPLKGGPIPEDLSGDAGQTLKETLEEVLQQPGARKVRWGHEVEHPENIRLYIDWDSVASHHAFMKTEGYKPFVEKFGSIVDLSGMKMYHANVKPHPPSEVLSKKTSPATEILLVYFPSNYPRADQDKFEEDWGHLIAAIEKHSQGYTHSAGGWVVEELEIPDVGGQGIVFAGYIGWKSVKHHIDFRSTPHFDQNIHFLRKAKNLQKIEVVHFEGNEFSG